MIRKIHEHVQAIDPKLLLWLAILLILWLVFISAVPDQFKPAPGEEDVLVTFKVFIDDTQMAERAIEVKTGTNGFDAMQQAFNIGFQDYGELGVMVETIDGVPPGENSFWKLFVNEEETMVGISSIIIEEETLFEWKTEEIQAYTG